jgi:hypothetical protein
MMNRHLFATALVAVFCLAGLASAQSGPAGGPVGGPPVNPTIPAVQPAVGALSDQSIEVALRALDANLRVRPSNDGKGKVYDLKVVRDGWSYDVVVETFAGNIWLGARLSPVISSPQNVPANILAELLKLNFKIGPTHFAFVGTNDNAGVMLLLYRSIDRTMSAEIFNAYISDFLKTIKESYPTWSQVR